MKCRFLFILAILIVGENLPAQSSKQQLLKSFIPENYSILDTASGDINNDGYKDIVLILKSDYEKSSTDTTRPLLLLLGTKKGGYVLFARNDSVVLCKGCGGVFGDPFEGITVEKGFFEINHYCGSAWRWTRNISFRYNVAKKQFILHRDTGISYHNSDPNKIENVSVRKKDFDKLPFNKYSYERDE